MKAKVKRKRKVRVKVDRVSDLAFKVAVIVGDRLERGMFTNDGLRLMLMQSVTEAASEAGIS